MSLQDAKLILTSNGYKAGKVYAVKPTDGTGDATVTRNTTKTRINSSGLIESDAVNVLAPDYLNGVCPALNVEGQATNFLLHSDGNISTYGTVSGQASNATTPILNFNNSIQVLQSATPATVFKRNFTATLGVDYIISVFVQMDDNSEPIPGISGVGDFSLVNDFSALGTYKISRVKNTNVYKVSMYRTATNASNVFGVQKDTGQSSKGFRFSGICVSEGTEPSSYIETTTAQVTRSADNVTVPIPAGTTEIIEKYEDGTTNTITTIPASPYTVPVGRYEYILMR